MVLTEKPETKREAGQAPGLRGPHGGSLSSLNALLLALLADRRRGGILSANGRTLFLFEQGGLKTRPPPLQLV